MPQCTVCTAYHACQFMVCIGKKIDIGSTQWTRTMALVREILKKNNAWKLPQQVYGVALLSNIKLQV